MEKRKATLLAEQLDLVLESLYTMEISYEGALEFLKQLILASEARDIRGN
jgi:hypothetical protein